MGAQRLLMLGCALVLVQGCAFTKYQEPALSSPYAELHMRSQQGGSTTGDLYDACADATCSPPNSLFRLAFMSWATGREALVRIDTTKRFYVAASLQESVVSGALASVISCTKILSFVPVAGRRYELTQKRGIDTCPVFLTDAATHTAPDSLIFHARVAAPR